MTLRAILQRRSVADIVKVTPETLVHEVIELLADRRIGAVPVLEGDEVVGIMSERDVIRALRRDGATMLDWPVERVMTRPPVTAEPDMTALEGLGLMTRRRFRHLPVIEHGRMVGFVSIGDLVKARIDRIEQEANAMREYIAS